MLDTDALAAQFGQTEPLITVAAAGLLLSEQAEAVQNHVAHQPWSSHGNRPVPLEVTYDAGDDRPYEQPWTVRYVAAVRGKQRIWKHARGRSLAEALQAARQEQTERYPQRLIDVLADDTMPEGDNPS